MRIMIIVDDYSDGAGNIAQLLAMELRDACHHVGIMITCYRSKPRYDLSGIDRIEISPQEKKGNKLTRIFHSIRRMREDINAFKADSVISFLDNNNTEACLALWDKETPILVSERSNPLVIYPKPLWHLLRMIAYLRADLIAVQFDAFKGFDHGFYRRKCITIPNIIAKATVEKVHSSNDRISFVTMARYASIKRIPLMISMFAELCKEKSNVMLHLFGKGMDNAELRKLLKQLHVEEYVFLHESIDHVHEELVKHDVYLMTSEQEGFPNALSEAMACGLPVVAFECHDGIHALIQNGENGYCVADNDQGAYVDAMRQLAADQQLRQQMGRCGTEIALRYNHEAVMEIWDQAIQQTLRRKHGKQK